jgi:hypothetical protein
MGWHVTVFSLSIYLLQSTVQICVIVFCCLFFFIVGTFVLLWPVLFLPLPLTACQDSRSSFHNCRCFLLLLRSLLFGLLFCLPLLFGVIVLVRQYGYFRHICSLMWFLLSVWNLLRCLLYPRGLLHCGVSGTVNVLLVLASFGRDSCYILQWNLSVGHSPCALSDGHED